MAAREGVGRRELGASPMCPAPSVLMIEPMTESSRPPSDDLLRSLLRLESAIARRPGFGHATQSSTTRSVTGLACESTEGHHLVRTNLPHGLGGRDTAPSPGALVRAALGSCLAMGYRLRAARYEVPLDAIAVTVETDSVLAGMLDLNATEPPGFTGIRIDVHVASPAPARDVRALIDDADRLSPVLDTVHRPIRSERTVRVNGRDS